MTNSNGNIALTTFNAIMDGTFDFDYPSDNILEDLFSTAKTASSQREYVETAKKIAEHTMTFYSEV